MCGVLSHRGSPGAGDCAIRLGADATLSVHRLSIKRRMPDRISHRGIRGARADNRHGMFLEFFCLSRHPRDPQRSRADVVFAWAGLLVFVAQQAYRALLKWQLNAWYKSFYDLLGEGEGIDRDVGSAEDPHTALGKIVGELAHKRQQVWDELGKFALIVLPAVFIHPLASWFRNVWVLRWRVAMVESYVSRWDVSKSPIEGASQRIHEDTSRFASGMHTCVATLLDAIFTLAIFVPTLYALDPQLAYVAVATAVGGVGVSAIVGRRLVTLEVNNQAAEAAFRRELVVLEVDPHLVDLSSNDTPLVVFRKLIDNLIDNYLAIPQLCRAQRVARHL